jgi:hypothetical protein
MHGETRKQEEAMGNGMGRNNTKQKGTRKQGTKKGRRGKDLPCGQKDVHRFFLGS